MKKFMLTCLVLLAGTFMPNIVTAQDAEVDPAKLADIKQYLVISGYKQSLVDGITEVAEMNRQNSDLPAEFWNLFEQRFNERIDELMTIVATVYSNHFTHDEIRKIIAFYKSDVGAKLVQNQGIVSREVNMITQQWGGELGREVGTELGMGGEQE